MMAIRFKWIETTWHRGEDTPNGTEVSAVVQYCTPKYGEGKISDIIRLRWKPGEVTCSHTFLEWSTAYKLRIF